MSLEIKIPTVGESILSGLLSAWHKAEGERVAPGDLLCTLETDKVSTELTAEGAGVLRILVPQGEEVKVGAVVGMIEEGADTASPLAANTALPQAAPEGRGQSCLRDGDATGRQDCPPPSGEAASPSVSSECLHKESLHQGSTAAAPLSTASSVPDSTPRTTRQKLSPLRRKIAARLVAAQREAAILTTFNECDMSAVMQLRTRHREAFETAHGVRLGFMSFFLKAVVAALRVVPAVNSRLDGDELVLQHFYDIGVAVGTERGLVVSVLRDVDSKPFAGLERELAAFAKAARNVGENRLRLEDLQGGVFTISNGGVYGSLLSTPILNPPQSGILGLHKIVERPVAVVGQVVIRPMMNLALSYDHRVVDGQEAVTFLVKIKEAIEEPERLLLGL